MIQILANLGMLGTTSAPGADGPDIALESGDLLTLEDGTTATAAEGAGTPTTTPPTRSKGGALRWVPPRPRARPRP